MDQVKRYDGLQLLIENINLYFLLHNFGVKIIPFTLGNLIWSFLAPVNPSIKKIVVLYNNKICIIINKLFEFMQG